MTRADDGAVDPPRRTPTGDSGDGAPPGDPAIGSATSAHENLYADGRRIQDTIENVDLFAVGLDLTGRVTFINDYALRVTGWGREEVINRDWFDTFVPAGRRAVVRGEFLRAIGGRPIPPHFDNSILTKSGQVRTVHWSNTVVRDHAGEVVGTFSLGEDRTELEEAANALRASERKNRLLLEHAGIGIGYYDLAGRIMMLNRKAAAQLGESPEAFAGRSAAEVFGDEWGSAIGDRIRQVLEAGEPLEFEDEIALPTGTKSFISTFAAIPGESGRPAGVQVASQEITARRRAEEKLRTSELRYHRLFDSMAEGFALHEIILDQHGRPTDYRFLDANPAFFKLTGLTPDIIGRRVREVLPDTEDFWIETYGRVATSGEPTEIDHVSRALGRRFEVRAFSPGPRKFATVFLDVTDRRRAEVERVTLLREIRGLTARLAAAEDAERKELARELHDRVGQSLTALGLNLSTLRGRLPADADAEFGARLDDAEHLLRVTAGEVRNVMAELRPPMLDEYGLLAALRWLGGQFSGRADVQVRVVGSEPEPRLGPEAEMTLFRIVQEALTNVAKHAGASAVEIGVEPSEAGAKVTVADDGIGFDPELARARAGGKRAWGQLIMRERAASIGATSTVRSEPGGGTTVTIAIARPAP